MERETVIMIMRFKFIIKQKSQYLLVFLD